MSCVAHRTSRTYARRAIMRIDAVEGERGSAMRGLRRRAILLYNRPIRALQPRTMRTARIVGATFYGFEHEREALALPCPANSLLACFFPTSTRRLHCWSVGRRNSPVTPTNCCHWLLSTPPSLRNGRISNPLLRAKASLARIRDVIPTPHSTTGVH